MQRSICCTCSWGGQWRCPPSYCTSPPPPRPPWTCTRCWPGASWGCLPRRARWPWGSRRARPVLWGRVPPIDRRSWTPSDFNIRFGQNQFSHLISNIIPPRLAGTASLKRNLFSKRNVKSLHKNWRCIFWQVLCFHKLNARCLAWLGGKDANFRDNLSNCAKTKIESLKTVRPGTRQAWRRCCTSNNNFSKSQRWLLLPEDRTGSVPRRTGWSTEGRRQWAEWSASPSNHLRSVYVQADLT